MKVNSVYFQRMAIHSAGEHPGSDDHALGMNLILRQSLPGFAAILRFRTLRGAGGTAACHARATRIAVQPSAHPTVFNLNTNLRHP